MEDALKVILLERKFRSTEYMEEMRVHLKMAIKSLEGAIQYFYAHPPQNENWHTWHQSDWPETWADRAMINLRMTYSSIEDGINNAAQGQYSTISSASGSLHNIFRNLSNMGWKWWDYTDPELKDRFHANLVQARNRASHIWWTTGGYWKAGEILDEEITGPIDEQELLRYLKPGETP